MSYVSTVLADAPVHYWRGADPGGFIFHDIGSIPYHAVALDLYTSSGYSGIAADGGSVFFRGGGGAFARSAPWLTDPFSLEIWFWKSWFVGGGNIQELIGTNHAVSSNLQIAANDKITFASGGGNLTSVGTPTAQAWHHVVATYGATGGIRIYIDGALDSNAAYGGAIPAASAIGFGSDPANGGLPCYNHLCEAAMYASELSAGRVAAHFAAQESSSPPVFLLPSTATGVSGGSAPLTGDLVSILNSVRKVY